MKKMVLSDTIENNENNENDENDKVQGRSKSRRKSGGLLKNFKNYCIIVSDYDDASKEAIKINYSVKFMPRKINRIEKNKNLSKYLLNNKNESKKHSKFSEHDKFD